MAFQDKKGAAMLESLYVWQRDERLGPSSWQEQNVAQNAVLGLTQGSTLPLVRWYSKSTMRAVSQRVKRPDRFS
jgi:hypothetical protein